MATISGRHTVCTEGVPHGGMSPPGHEPYLAAAGVQTLATAMEWHGICRVICAAVVTAAAVFDIARGLLGDVQIKDFNTHRDYS